MGSYLSSGREISEKESEVKCCGVEGGFHTFTAPGDGVAGCVTGTEGEKCRGKNLKRNLGY